MTREFKTLSLVEVAEIARCHPDTVRRAVKRGELPTAGRRRGSQGKILIWEQDALNWALGGADTAPENIGRKNTSTKETENGTNE